MTTLSADAPPRAPIQSGRHRRPEPTAVSLAHPDVPRPLGQPGGRHRRAEPASAATANAAQSPGRHRCPEPLRVTVGPLHVAASTPTRPPRRTQGRRQRRSRPALRPAVTAGIAIVGAGALVGAITTPAATAIQLTALQQSATVSTDPTPTPLLAALVGDLNCADATTGQCPDNVLATMIGALLNFAAVGADGALLTWDNVVNLGADVVANIALAPAALGVALSTGLSTAIENIVAMLAPLGGPIATPVFDGLATLVDDVSAFVNVGIGGLGEAVAWKAQLDAVLADLVATGGAALVNGLTTGVLGLVGLVPGGLPEIDFTDAAAALGAVINHVGAGLDALMLGWDTAVNLGADIVGTLALTVSATGTAITGAITNAVLNGVAALADLAGPIAGPVFTAITNLVTGVSGLITTAITIPSAAIAWKAQLDAVLADVVATGGVALTNNLTGGLMGLVGAEPVGLPDIGSTEVCASLNALVDHLTVGLAGVFTGEVTVDPGTAALTAPDSAATDTRTASRLAAAADPAESPDVATVDSTSAAPIPEKDPSAATEPSSTEQPAKTSVHSKRGSHSKETKTRGHRDR